MHGKQFLKRPKESHGPQLIVCGPANGPRKVKIQAGSSKLEKPSCKVQVRKAKLDKPHAAKPIWKTQSDKTSSEFQVGQNMEIQTTPRAPKTPQTNM